MCRMPQHGPEWSEGNKAPRSIRAHYKRMYMRKQAHAWRWGSKGRGSRYACSGGIVRAFVHGQIAGGLTARAMLLSPRGPSTATSARLLASACRGRGLQPCLGDSSRWQYNGRSGA